MTNYIVLEIQHYADGTSAFLPLNTYENRNDAESKYHSVLAAAAVSSVFDHCCSMLDREGRTIKAEHFPHGQSNFQPVVPEEEPEGEPVDNGEGE